MSTTTSNPSDSLSARAPRRTPVGSANVENGAATTRLQASSRPAVARGKRKENNLMTKGLIALASIVVTLGGWGFFATHDISTSQAASSAVAVTSDSQQTQSVDSLRTVNGTQTQQRQSRPLFITRTRSSR
ncbi:MAG: hypothetical protein U0175_13035 [Caldilineaceae bacterium]